jgi:hypothetical protein
MRRNPEKQGVFFIVSERSKAFPRLGSGDSYYRTDYTILPTLSMTTEVIYGVVVRRSEMFIRVLACAVNSGTLNYWGITEEGIGEKKTVKLAEVIDWGTKQDGFEQSYLLGARRLDVTLE